MAKGSKTTKSPVKKAAAKKKAVTKKATSKKAVAKKTRAVGKMEAAAAAPSAPVPYKCVHTPYDHRKCIKFMYNSATGNWDLPPEGILVDCGECKYF